MGRADGFRRIRELFEHVVAVPAADRNARLRELEADPELLAEVRRLLSAHDASAPFAESGPIVPARPLLEPPDAATAGIVLGAYELEERIAAGGMGSVWRARRRDDPERRPLAIKFARVGLLGTDVARRFRREQATLAALSHPGIARFLDAGCSDDGTRWFVMEYIDGEHLVDWCELRRLTTEARLELFLQLCDAVGHAHRQLVVHRDLKPSNVLVTREGRVKVVDFGLAKLLDDAATAAETTAPGEHRLTARYASPEQFERGPISAATDVHALGRMLGELLTGQVPEASLDGRRSPNPQPRRRLLPHDLDAILERAVRAEPTQRYRDANRLAEDLRRHLSGLPVEARPLAPVERLARALRRRWRAAALTGFAVLSVASASALALQRRAAREAADEREQRQRATLLSFLDGDALDRLHEDARALLIDHDAAPERWREWIGRAEELLTHHPALQELDGTLAGSSGASAWHHEVTQRLLARLDRLSGDAPESPDSSRDTTPDGARMAPFAPHALLRRARARLDQIEAEIASLAGGGADGWPPGLPPQRGLVPLGRDPESGLHEFWHTASGARPVRDPVRNQWVIAEETGIVLVLLPGGRASIGAQATDPMAPYFDPDATTDEGPPREVEFTPCFAAKHELTQGQWLRATGLNPSQWRAGLLLRKTGSAIHDLRHPVENIDLRAAAAVVASLGLTLPTEAQWEVAARARTTTRWCTGDDPRSLEGAANLADRSAVEIGATYSALRGDPAPFTDGWGTSAPVGSFRPNAFGLHDVHGNVAEWCAEVYRPFAAPADRAATPLMVGPDVRARRVHRGGSLNYGPKQVRSAARFTLTDGNASLCGVRAFRSLDPTAGAAEARGR